MIPTTELFSIIRKNNIKLGFVDFPLGVDGYYNGEVTPKSILLSRLLKHNRKGFRSALARQLGYACTCPKMQECKKKRFHIL